MAQEPIEDDRGDHLIAEDLAPIYEAGPRQLADHLIVDQGLKAKIEIAPAYSTREASPRKTQLVSTPMPALPFGLQSLGEKLPVAELALCRLLADRIELSAGMFHAELFEETYEPHKPTSS